MLFDFDTFGDLVKRCYDNLPEDHSELYSIDEAKYVFRYYFLKYEQKFFKPHPNIRINQIKNIIQLMPYICREDQGQAIEYIPYDAYEYLIAKHFETKYPRCDYNINHFFSGRIREFRLFEVFF